MIGRLRGVIAETGEEEALIDVGGVGYLVRCGARTLSRLPSPGGEATLHIESAWGEATGLTLYGFLSRDEQRVFVLLRAIQGVGPKVALSVLDVAPPAELAAAVARQDKALVSRASGVGPKLAARIVAELKDKPIAGGAVLAGVAAPAAFVAATPAGEAVAALMGLGVAEPSARRAVDLALARLGGEAPEAQLIRAALQELGR